MYIQLEQKDYDAIAEMIAIASDETRIWYDEFIEVNYEVDGTGYYDDDYLNGTGDYIVTSVDVNLKEVKCADFEIRYNHDKLKETIENLLWG